MFRPEQFRPMYPDLETGQMWLNHAGTSPLSTRVVDALQQMLVLRSEGAIDNFFDFAKTTLRTKQLAGALLNCAPERIAFTDNTSNGLNILASGLDWKPGDRIILNTIEFPSNVYPFLNLKRLGVEIDFIPEREGRIETADIAAAITPRTRLLSISFVQFLTGWKAPLAELGDLCARHGIVFCVDGIQGLGAAPIDVRAAKIGFLSSATHKWLMGLHGFGFVYVTEELQERIHQAYMGWTSNSDFFGKFLDYEIRLDPSARRYENGALNSMGVIALHEALATLLDIGIDTIHSHLLDLTDRIAEGMMALGFEPRTPPARSERAGIMTFRVPDAQQLFTALKHEKIITAPREGSLRISPHYYNSHEDMDRFLAVLRNIIQK